jgi:hypothetical protein
MEQSQHPKDTRAYFDLEHLSAPDKSIDRIDKALSLRFATGYKDNLECFRQERRTLIEFTNILAQYKPFIGEEQAGASKYAFQGLMVGSTIGALILGQKQWALDRSLLDQGVPPVAEDLQHLGHTYLAESPSLQWLSEKYLGTAACPGLQPAAMREIAYDGIGLALRQTNEYHVRKLQEQAFADLPVIEQVPHEAR